MRSTAPTSIFRPKGLSTCPKPWFSWFSKFDPTLTPTVLFTAIFPGHEVVIFWTGIFKCVFWRKGFGIRLLAPEKIQKNRPKKLFFLADINLKNNPGPGKILLRFSPFYSKTCLYKPYLLKTLCAAKRKRRFFDQKGLSTCPKPWFSWFSKIRPDLDPNRSFYCDFSWTWGCDFLNRHIRMRVLTKGYWNPLAVARENQKNRPKHIFFLADINLKNNPGPGKVLLRVSTFLVLPVSTSHIS